MSEQKPDATIAAALHQAIRRRLEAPRGRFYAVRAIEDGHVLTQVVVADSVGMPQSGHLVFAQNDPASNESRVVRIYVPSMWLGVRDLTSEGSDVVAEFLASLERGAVGTA